jgi:hypothetical protein
MPGELVPKDDWLGALTEVSCETLRTARKAQSRQ